MGRWCVSKVGAIDGISTARIFEQDRTRGGFVAQLRSDSSGRLDVPELTQALVSVHVGRAAKMSCRRGGLSHTGMAVHGDIDIIPACVAARWEMLDENDQALLLVMPRQLLDAVAEEHGGPAGRPLELRNRFQHRDRQLQSIAWAIKSELEMGSPSGQLYLEGLGQSVAARLVAAHSSVSVSEQRHGGLDGRRLKLALEFIEANLTAELTLTELATTAGMSVSHFRSGFRRSVGVPVHQYVIERRLECAKGLLMREDYTIAEVALASGFTHQSHLARHMQRSTGLSPLQMKRVIAGRFNLGAR
jgi:AraC family transcriptional regulator